MKLLKSSNLFALAFCVAATIPGAAAVPTDLVQTWATEVACRKSGGKNAAGQNCIAVGNDGTSTTVWTFGASSCDAVTLAPLDADPCGSYFTLNALGTPADYILMGCGGPMWANTHGGFFANCDPVLPDTSGDSGPGGGCGTYKYLCA
ncbi:hypothetical protein FB451DRAFT_1485465 [Mycena latifolia]|nr:hypothetical protein FB451DRAFT_1485465 [Mycena latifolia]